MTCSNGFGGVTWELVEGPEFSNWMVGGRCVCFFQASNVFSRFPHFHDICSIPIIVVNNPSIKALFVGVEVVVPFSFP